MTTPKVRKQPLSLFGHTTALVVTLQNHSSTLNSTVSSMAAEPRHNLSHLSNRAPLDAVTNCPL